MSEHFSDNSIIFGGRADLYSNIAYFILGNCFGFFMGSIFLLVGDSTTSFAAGYLFGLILTFLRFPQTNKIKIFELLLLVFTLYFIVIFFINMPTVSRSNYLWNGVIGIMSTLAFTFLFLAIWRANAYKILINRIKVI